MSDVEQIEQAQEVDTNAVENVKKEPRLVPMEDGTTANFGIRGTLLTAFDTETNTVTFKLVTGKVIKYVQEDIAEFTEFQKKVFLYGLLSKVRTVVGTAPIDKLEAAIAKQLAELATEQFHTRGEGKEDTLSLTNLQKAFAIVKSNPAFSSDPKPHWANYDDPAVIVEVLEAWAAASVTEKNNIRKNAYVKLEQSKLDIAEQAVLL